MSNSDKTTSSNTSHLIIVGSSAGGIEALSVFVGTLPANFPAPIVLAQHLDPTRPSSLVALLQRHTALPVHAITAHTPLQPGEIYVVPPNCYATIHDGYVEMQDHQARRPKPSVDVLLSSAAKAYGKRLIAVILTGSGSDGAAGAIEVKHAGGTVIIQNPQTARFPSMPLALPPSIVDFQVDLERLGRLLYDLLTGAGIPPDGQNEEVLRRILDHVKNHARTDFHLYQTSTLLQHIGYRMVVIAIPTMQDYLHYLQSTPAEVEELVKSLLVLAPQFFRDPGVFAYMKRDILPEIVARGRDHHYTLRFWMVGCATGEEAYSFAMLLTDLLGAELPHWTIKIFATNLNEAAISFARHGLYAETLLKGVSPEYVQRFFMHVDHGYRIAKILRQMVIFGPHDFSRDAPFPHIDLVVCRNMLRYFTPDFQEFVLNRLTLSLFPGGYLLLDKTEAIHPPPPTLYEPVSKPWNAYRCINHAAPSSQYRGSEPQMKMTRSQGRSRNHPAHGRLQEIAPTAVQPGEQQGAFSTFDAGQTGHINELLLRSLPIGIVVIDRAYHIVTANRISRHLLGLHTAPEEQDFLHAVPGIPYTEVRNAIESAFQEHSTITLPEVELDVIAGGNRYFLALSIAPLQCNTSPPELAAISIIDITKQTQTRRHLEAIQAEQAQFMSELSTANKRLNEVNTALLDTNEQFHTANEELILAQEEHQATSEELETTNEELQADLEELEATNEELETANEELQVTNVEFETTTEELRVHTEALQEQNAWLERKQAHLVEIIEHAPFSVIWLRGADLLVESLNARSKEQLKGQEALGRSLVDVASLFWGADSSIVRLANEVYQQDAPRTTLKVLVQRSETTGESRVSYLLYTLVPAHDASGNVAGVIIYTTDETEQRVKEAEMNQLDVTH